MRQPIAFGKYLLLERVSVGGMAEVFKAKSFGVEGFEKIIAIKRILPSMSEDGEFVEMFIDEAKIAGQLSHANICQIFELGKIGDNHFIAMEYIWGKDLLQIQNRFRKLRQRMPIPLACHVAAKVCEGLDYAHRRKDPTGRPLQIIHRDVSPQNVLVSYEGEVKIIDFGIAKAAVRSSRTQAGVLKGKFGYMSPEQVRGLPLDRRSDLFAIGTLLYECLTGDRLFANDSDFSTLERVRAADVPSPRKANPKVPPDLEAIVMKALARNVEDRYQWANELQDDLTGLLAKMEPVFTAKQLSSWMKEAFGQDLARERQQLEAYKRMAPAAPPPHDGDGDGDELADTSEEPTDIGGPSFEDEAPTEVFSDSPSGRVPGVPAPMSESQHSVSPDGVVRAPMPSVDIAVPQVQVPMPTEPLLSSGAPAMPLRSPPSLPTVTPVPALGKAGSGSLPIAAPPPSAPGLSPSPIGPPRRRSGANPQVTPTGLSVGYATPTPSMRSVPTSSMSARLPPLRDSGRSTLLRDVLIGVGAAVLVAGTIAGAYFLGTRVLSRRDPAREPAAPTATVIISTGDSGEGDVYIDGVRKGAIHGGEPLTVDGLAPGEIEIAVKRAGVADCVQRIAVDNRPRVVTCRFQAAQTTGTVLLTVITDGAVVLVDDQEISADAAREPIYVSADTLHKITVKKDGFLPQTLPINLHSGEVSSPKVELERAPPPAPKGTSSRPHEHEHDRDKTPAPEHGAADSEPAPSGGPDAGGFLIAETKPWAKLMIDGRDTGKSTPITARGKIPLAAGKHVITFDYNGQRVSYTIMVEPGQDYRLTKQLPVSEGAQGP